MSLSPGEQERASPPSLRRVGLLLVVVVVATVVLFTARQSLREYWLYLTEDRPPIQFSFDELSEGWTEADLRTRFAGMKITCDQSFDRHLDERACFIDVQSHNHVPAMFVAFFFASGKLSRASVNIPWWAHDLGYKSLELAYGKSASSQARPIADVRLHGWPLKGGGAIFYNRDKPVNPLAWNAAFWNSASSCAKNSCFTNR